MIIAPKQLQISIDSHPLRVKFRIEEVSKKHDNMKFRIKVFSAPCDNDGSGEL